MKCLRCEHIEGLMTCVGMRYFCLLTGSGINTAGEVNSDCPLKSNAGEITITVNADTSCVHRELDILEARLITIGNRIDRILENAKSITGERC